MHQPKAHRPAAPPAGAPRAEAAVPDRARAEGGAALRLATYLPGARASAAAGGQPGGGDPLPDALVERFSRQTGHDLGGVRVRADAGAAREADAASARAFAQGSEVWFGRGEYRPDTPRGLRLLGHEVGHVLQQSLPGLPPATPAQAEADADAFAGALASGADAGVRFSTPRRRAFAPRKVREGDEAVSVTIGSTKALVTMRSGDVFPFDVAKNSLKPGTYSARAGGKGEFIVKLKDPAQGWVVRFSGGPPAPGDIVYAASVAVVVKTGPVEAGSGAGDSGTGKGSGSGKGSGTGEGSGSGGKTPPTPAPGEGGGGEKGAEKGAEGEKGGGTGGDGTTATAPPPPDAKVPVVTVTDLKQVEELKKHGLIPADRADQIKAKLEKQENLTFEEALALVEGLNRVKEPSPTQPEADAARQSWLEWAKFVQENKDRISGRAKGTDTGLTIAEVKDVLAKYNEYVAMTAAPPTTGVKDKLKDPALAKAWNELAPWEKEMWTAYAAKNPGARTDSGRTDFHITDSDKFGMALQLSPQYMPAGGAEAARQLFTDPIFIGSIVASLMIYFVLWLNPEPIFSKATAAAITLALLAVFTAIEIRNLAVAWMNLDGEAAKATTLPELEAAAERFGKAVGGVGMRVIIMIATIWAGKALGGLKRPPPTGGGGMAPAPLGPPVPATAAAEAVAVQVLADGTVAILPTAGAVMMSGNGSGSGGGGDGSGKPGSGDKPPAPAEEPPAAGKEKPPAPAEEPAPGSKPPAGPAAAPRPYVNNNPKATPAETRVGQMLDAEAQAGKLPGVKRVEGAAEIKSQRSGDYRFEGADGKKVPGDLYEPQGSKPENIFSNIIDKSGQAETVVVELGGGKSGEITAEAAKQIARSVLDTPGHGIRRIIFIKDGVIIVDVF